MVLKNSGVNRVSLGVQDFQEATLKAIKREQSFEMVAQSVKYLRDLKITSINFDLVYGLPYQSLETMRKTIAKVIELLPSRIALYSYAHIPQAKPAQVGVERHGLPSAKEKLALYELAKELLLENGYSEIGMDHFALPDDELSMAAQRRALHRNFMGYTVRKTKLLLGLGPSSLSDAWGAFAQNEKEVDLWLAQIESGDVSPRGGHLLSSEDLLRREIILNLMCNHNAHISKELWQSLQHSNVVADQLVSWEPESLNLEVTKQGKTFVRNICAEFDGYLKNSTERKTTFSRSV